jgi:uncharacterized membrane protein
MNREPVEVVDAIPSVDEEPTPARIEAFSDGVFAIIITLLVLDMHVPRENALGDGTLAEALSHQWPVYVAVVFSFLQVGVVWINHHAMFHYIRRSDHRLLFYNLMLLLCAAMLPFTSALLAEYARAGKAEMRLAALIYSGVLCLCGTFFSAVWQHALSAKLVKAQANPYRLQALRLHWLLMPVLYGMAFALALVNARLSLVIYVVLLVYYGLPGPALLRWMTARNTRIAADEHRSRG